MPIDIHAIAIALMELFGIAFFLFSFLFLLQSRRIGDKLRALQEALRKATPTQRRWHRSYSFKWTMSHSLKSRGLVASIIRFAGVGGFLIMGIVFLSILLTVVVFTIFHSAGYTLFIGLIGVAILLETEALEAYSYVRSVRKVELDQLIEDDLGYMKMAKEVFERATIRFFIVGIAFAVFGPFVPQIFQNVVYIFSFYLKHTLFQATETAGNVSILLAIMIATILPGILLFLPELLGRTLISGIKRLISKSVQRRG